MAHVGVNLVTQQTTDKDELFICPFDPVHRISAKRYVYHIVKCRKNHLHLETATCPFNARHIVLKPELRHHTNVCPDRKAVEIELNSLDISELPNDRLAASNGVLDFGDDEDWDEEIERNKGVNVVDPFAADTTFNGHSNHKKTNTRREAIKRMKEKMRREAEAKGPHPWMQSTEEGSSLRRPDFETGAKANAFAAFYAAAKAKTNRSEAVAQEKPSLQKQSKHKPKLAANFSMAPKAPAAGRGRHLRELQVAVGRGRAVQPTKNSPGLAGDVSLVSNGGTTVLDGLCGAEDLRTDVDAAHNTEWGFDVVHCRRKNTVNAWKQ